MFVTEARDLLEQISKGLLSLESAPDDVQTMNGIFRALHTLKGSSGLFEPDLDAVRRVSHAGEDLLDAVRNGRFAFTSEMADPLLDSLDAVGHWLDAAEGGGAVPLEAEAASHEMATQLRRFLDTNPEEGKNAYAVGEKPPVAAGPEWLTELPEAQREAIRRRGEETMDDMVAIHYVPYSQCFFTGEDPLHLMGQVPGLVALHVDSTQPWPPAAELDPFKCALRFQAVSDAPQEAVQKLFRYVEDQVEITVFNPCPPTATDTPVPAPTPPKTVSGEEAMAAQILRDQLSILDLPCPVEDWEGRLAPMARVLAALFARRGLSGPLAALDAVMKEVHGKHAFAPLRAFLAPLVTEAIPTAVPEKPAQKRVPEKPAQKRVPGEPTETVPEAAVVLPNIEMRRRATDVPGRDKTLRIDQSRIDRLMDLIGELVVAKNSVPFLARRAERKYGVRPLAREIMEFFGVINRLSEELQSSIMQVRMMPVSPIFQRFPRLVRDMSRKLNKEINLVLAGGETEADKNIVELLSDPLIHLVRNSLDHGIESPEARKAAGKNPQGEITLTAFQESDRVVIEIQDDGKGVDPEVIKKKAYEKGILNDERLETISDHDAVQLIFAAGFSTADQVSDLSGRGVGMDVVRSAVEGVGGSVVVFSTKGEGSRVRLELPMTMAVSRVMLIEQGRSLFGVPLDMVSETVRVATA